MKETIKEFNTMKESECSQDVGYITTYTGVHFYPTAPSPEDIHIEDIAHALSYICRGNGHVKNFFSVGQHCVNCALESMARGYGRRVSLACLLHDAGEAYMSDVPRPIKVGMPQYKKWEEALLQVVYEKFLGSVLTEEESVLVKQIDDDMLYFDMKVLLGEEISENVPQMMSLFSQEYVPFIEVEEEYLNIFKKLYKEKSRNTKSSEIINQIVKKP